MAVAAEHLPGQVTGDLHDHLVAGAGLHKLSDQRVAVIVSRAFSVGRAPDRAMATFQFGGMVGNPFELRYTSDRLESRSCVERIRSKAVILGSHFFRLRNSSSHWLTPATADRPPTVRALSPAKPGTSSGCRSPRRILENTFRRLGGPILCPPA